LPSKKALENYLETYHFREALKEAMNIARIGNKYISDTEPWKVAKTDMDRTASILYTSLQICADLAIAFEPFLPFSAEKLRSILKVGLKAGCDYRRGEGEPTVNFYKKGEGKAVHTSCSGDYCVELDWNMFGQANILPVGHQLGEPVLLFAKIEDSVIDAQMSKLASIKAANDAAEIDKKAEKDFNKRNDDNAKSTGKFNTSRPYGRVIYTGNGEKMSDYSSKEDQAVQDAFSHKFDITVIGDLNNYNPY